MDPSDMLALANFLLTSFGGWICVCRMTKMSASETKFQIRAQYSIWFALFAISGWSFAFFDETNIVQLLMGVGIIAHLAIGVGVWRDEAPHYTRRVA